jgi:hypothetical protein
MERDDETGLGYHSARYYAGWLGRWVACDPIGVADGLNVYAYVGGRPVESRDGGAARRLSAKRLAVATTGAVIGGARLEPHAAEEQQQAALAGVEGWQATVDVVGATSPGAPLSLAPSPSAASSGGGDFVTLWKAPRSGRTSAADEVVSGFDPKNYPGLGPFLSKTKEGATIWQRFYNNGLQEFRIPRSTYDNLVERGVIKPDFYQADAVYVPAEGLEAFNRALMQGPMNLYHAQ